MIVTLMRHDTILRKLANYLVAAVLVLVPFHAFLTIWLSQLVGHYTLLRLWDEVALLALIIICFVWLAQDKALRDRLSKSLLVKLIVAYAALTILLGVVSIAKGEVTAKALAYGLLVNLRYLAWFVAVGVVVQRSPWLARKWPRLVLAPAVVVVVFAGLQYTVLPNNFLAHFGYNAATTIAPIETINHNPNYIRVMSTLRGANPLGAYLVIVGSALAAFVLAGRRRLFCAALGLLTLLALFASGSRSAWLGLVLAVAIICYSGLKGRRARFMLAGASAAIVVFALTGFLLLRHNQSVQNAVLHTQDASSVRVTSNGAHASALRTGLKDVVAQPFGDGPGTAGPASVYNTGHPTRLAENYYVQVAQETGWFGLALFGCILSVLGIRLYRLAGVSRLALSMFASLIGLCIVNLLSHAWVDDTLAYLWWGLAAIAVAHSEEKTHEV